MALSREDAEELLRAGWKAPAVAALGRCADRGGFDICTIYPGLVELERLDLNALKGTCYQRIVAHPTLTFPASYDAWADLPSGTLVEAWTDGSGVATDEAVGCAAVMVVSGQPLEKAHIFTHSIPGPATSQVAELTAFALALANCPRTDLRLHIRSDSAYSLGILDAKQDWKPKKNQGLVAAIRRHLALRPATTEHVSGHAGVPGNEMADKAAGRARIKSRSS